jgi:GxxExxY protein
LKINSALRGAQVVSSVVMHDAQPDVDTFRIIGAAMEVHRRLHRGLAEAIYCEALAIEFDLRSIPFEAQRPLTMAYKGHRLTGVYKVDFICFNSVIVEVKGVSGLTPADEAQLLNYLAMSGLERGLLMNFGARSLEYKRRVL